MSSLRPRGHERRGAVAAFAVAFSLVLALLGALPLAHRYLPLVDWPQHLAQDAVVAHEGDRAFATDRYYRTTGWFLPYQGFRRVHVALARVTGDDLSSARVTLAVAFVGTALALLSIARALGRSPWIAVAGCTVIVEANALWGFAPYVLATTLQLAQLAVVLWWLRRRADAPDTWGAGALAVVALVGVAMFFTHAQPTALACLSVAALGVVSLARGRIDRKRLAALALAMLPCAMLCALYLVGAGWLSGEALEDEFRITPRTLFRPPWAALWWLPLSAGLDALGDGPWRAYVLAVLACAIGARASRRPDTDAGDTGESRRSYAVEAWALFAVFAGAYVLLPSEFRGQTLAPRVASIALLSFTWVFRWQNDPPADAHPRWTTMGRAARVMVTAAAVGSLSLAHVAFARFDHVVRPLEGGFATLPQGARVATLVYSPHVEGFRLPVLLHVGAYALVARGGMSSMGFTRTGVTYRREVPRGALTVMELWGPSVAGWQLDPARHGDYYDAVFVVRGPRYPGHPFRGGNLSGVRVERAWSEGRFELWRVRR
jgi:hypothetical protein